MLDPKTILFSLPSICGTALPQLVPGSGLDDVVVLHEDDWRQCEFVASSQRENISAELSSIRHIHAAAAVDVGWREIHVRERIAHPLPAGTTWAIIAEQLGQFERVSGIAVGDKANLVVGAVAARLPDNVVVWGVEEAGALTVLCVENLDAAAEETIAALKGVADSFGFALIQWCRCQVYVSDGTAIAHSMGAPWRDRSC